MLLVLGACDSPCESGRGDSAADTGTTPLTEPVVVCCFDTPESALYDAVHDRYLVSNISGGPQEHDGVGWISVVRPDGSLQESPLAEGLDAPKGMTLLDDVLYVADIDVVRSFSADGEALDVWAFEADFLNDLTVDGDVVLVSDSGAASGTSVWALPDVARLDADVFPNPNGLAVDGALRAVSGSGLYTEGGGVEEVGAGVLDGIVVRDGALLVSSWAEQAVWTDASGAWAPLVEGLESPADIGWDSVRDRLLVPHFSAGELSIIPL